MDAYHDAMVTDEPLDESQEQSQQQTQSTQQASQQSNVSLDSHLWGYLQPCSPSLTRIDLWKIHPRYTIGRNTEQNHIVLPGFKVSNLHCTITWDGSDKIGSTVTVQDLSSNGTFINGVKIGKNQTRILCEGQEIAFGTSVPQHQNGGLEDYRFVYRHTASGLPTEGLYAYYDISTELGKGSFATVMKAVSRSTGEWYAVKMIHESKNLRSSGEQQVKNMHSRSTAFAREISIIERLKHPNICAFKEVFFHDNNDINIVLELVEGGDLLDYILRNNGLSEVEAQHITYQICDALAYIHSQGVAHRDLKPENVLLTTDNPPIVKVADFGLAKVVDSLTMLRTMCGTPSYLAPEIVKQQNEEGYDNLVDSWSVGVIVFSMLTNASPFIEDENQRDIRTRISERRIDWSYLANGEISVQAQDFIRCLLEEDPLQRMALADALHHPWLQAYTPVYDHRPFMSATSIPGNDFSMLSAISENERGFYNDPMNTSAISNGLNGIKREGSRTAPLKRRSDLLSQAAENGNPLTEPSWEMIAAAQPAGPSNITTSRHRRQSPAPIPLDSGPIDSQTNGSSPLSDPDSFLYSGKSTDEDHKVAGGVGKTPRGKGRTAATTPYTNRGGRSRVVKAAEVAEDGALHPRRSNRHQKPARHA